MPSPRMPFDDHWFDLRLKTLIIVFNHNNACLDQYNDNKFFFTEYNDNKLSVDTCLVAAYARCKEQTIIVVSLYNYLKFYVTFLVYW